MLYTLNVYNFIFQKKNGCQIVGHYVHVQSRRKGEGQYPL